VSIEERILNIAEGPNWYDSRELRAIALDVRKMEERIKRLEREVELLRFYGNKDCTAQADEVLTKEGGQAVSDEQITAQATPAGELRRQILSPHIGKNEREWWAAGTIEKLEFELNAANDRIKRLEEAGDDLCANSCPTRWDSLQAANRKLKERDAWRKAKEDKP
jgi:hypothetical protein